MSSSKEGEQILAAGPRDQVQSGVDGYRRVLLPVGGHEIRTLMRCGERAAVCTALYKTPPCDLHVPELPVGRLAINLTRSSVSGGREGEEGHDFAAERYSLFLAPAGVPVHWHKKSPSRHMTLFFHADVFDDGLDSTACLQTQWASNVQVPGIRNLVDALVDELGSPGIYDAEVADSLARVLLVRVARHLRLTSNSADPLTPRMLGELRDYVQANLSERILVADLANRVDLSPARFAALCREQTGHSPHQFVVSLRLASATDLLAHSCLSLAQIAQECGFANQQHLSNTMRRHLRTTPNRYRATVQSREPVECEAGTDSVQPDASDAPRQLPSNRLTSANVHAPRMRRA